MAKTIREHLQYEVVGYQVPCPKMLDVSFHEELQDPIFEKQKVCTLSATIGTRFVCTDEHMDYMKEKAVTSVVRFLYKDLHDDMYELLKHVYESNDSDAITMITNIMEKIT